MTYAGDNSLSEEIRQRVEETFKQSRQLAAEGKIQEATLGCEFILRLDSLYEPARELLQRIESGDDLGAGEDAAPAAGAVDSPEGFEPQAPAAPDESAPADDAAGGADEAVDLRAEMEDLLDKRDFRTLLNLAQEKPEALAADPELATLVGQANERLEAEPYVRTFIDSAEKAHREGKANEAEALIEKARALDPSHPALPPEPVKSDYQESNERIRELLEEGQNALERNDHQGAIDSWSRIFLIDIDHDEANRRIEQARRRKAEHERQVEEAFHEGVSQWELGGTDRAREQFEKVLSLAPNHVAAKEYIERMDAREGEGEPLGGGAAEPSGDQEILTPPDSLAFARGKAEERGREETGELPDLADLPEPAASETVDVDDIEIGGEAEPAPPAEPARRTGGPLGNKRFVTLAGLGVLLVGAVLAALYWKRDVFFPNSEETPAVAQVDVLARARKLQEAGETARAIAQLRRLPTAHPQYAEAQSLIAQWEASQVEAVEEETGPSEAELAARDALVAQAQAARDDRRYLLAAGFYQEAEKIAPLDEQDRFLYEEVQQRLAGLESQIELFEQGDWEFVLPDLWRLHSANPDDKDVTKLMVDSYFNLGVRDLQRGDIPAAKEKFERAQELDPSDAQVERLLRFSQVYEERATDLMYRIFVKYTSFR